MSEEERGKMDKKSNPRQSQPLQRNGADVRKESSSRNQRWGKRRGNCSSGNLNYNEGQGKKPTPQKYKNSWDKRPRPRGEFSERSRRDLEESYEAEYGAAIPTGSKKGNLNHLLNFSYAEDEGSYRRRAGNSRGGWGRGRQVQHRSSYSRGSKMYYNKEQFLQANCQFVVKESGNYSVQLMDPDTLVDWTAIEQVRVIGSEDPSCPICLDHPTAAKMTRCGHIFCWACILHYIAVGEKAWRKCPICYEAVQSDDLKSVISRKVKNYKVGDTITMTLMRKEKGSIYAVPAHLWQKTETKCHNLHENEEVTRHVKLLTARADQVLAQMDREGEELMVQLACAESSEEPFIKGAQQQLKAKQDALQEVTVLLESFKSVETPDSVETSPETEMPNVASAASNKKIKTYKSAFSDEEDEEDEDPAESVQDKTAQTSPSDTDAQPAQELTECPADASEVAQLDDTQSEDSPKSPTAEGLPSSNPPQHPVSPDQAELMPDALPVDEAAEQLELPTTTNSEKSRNRSGDNSFYFYQSEDGQHIYLHSLNARCLVREYGSLENSPQKITANVVEKESVFVSEELRKRLRYLNHLPLTCGFEVVELNMRAPLLGKDTIKHFSEEIEKRRRMRQRRNRDERRMARRIEEEERKKLGITHSTIIPSQFGRLSGASEHSLDNRSDTSSPSLDTPIGSPGVHGADYQSMSSPGSKEAEDGSQSSVVSFAQMLKAGSKAAPVWPAKKKSDTMSSTSHSHRLKDSDESDNEDKIPVPEYHSSFGSAIEAALVNMDHVRTDISQASAADSGGRANGGKSGGKKKKKQLVLFSTSMARGGN